MKQSTTRGSELLQKVAYNNRSKIRKNSIIDWFVIAMLKQTQPYTKNEIISVVAIEILEDNIKKRIEQGEEDLELFDLYNPDHEELFLNKASSIKTTIQHCVSKGNTNTSIHGNDKYKNIYFVESIGGGKNKTFSLVKK
jgi:hypothetical protein